MPGGRPAKPTALKLLHGTARKDRANPAEPEPQDGPIKPPSWLKGDGRRAWRWLAPQLAEMRVLTAADPHALALLCDAYAEYLAAREIVRTAGMTYACETAKGGVMVRKRPEVEIAADAWRRISAMMQQFGLTPSSRVKVQAQPETERDPFEEFIGDHSRAG